MKGNIEKTLKHLITLIYKNNNDNERLVLEYHNLRLCVVINNWLYWTELNECLDIDKLYNDAVTMNITAIYDINTDLSGLSSSTRIFSNTITEEDNPNIGSMVNNYNDTIKLVINQNNNNITGVRRCVDIKSGA